MNEIRKYENYLFAHTYIGGEKDCQTTDCFTLAGRIQKEEILWKKVLFAE